MPIGRHRQNTRKESKLFQVNHTGSGRPLIFLHNGGTCSAIWREQVRTLSKTYTCYALDLPGFGPAGETTYSPYTLEDLASGLEAFRRRINAERFSLLGNCMGSAIALRYTLRYPERVERLVLFNILTQETLQAGFLGPLVRWTALPGLRRGLRRWLGLFRLPKTMSRWMVLQQFRKPIKHWVEELALLYRQKSQSKALLDILVDMPSYEELDHLTLPRNFPPTLVIWGEQNRVLPLEAGQRLCARLGISPRVLPGGHLLMLEEPETVNHILSDFLEDLPL